MTPLSAPPATPRCPAWVLVLLLLASTVGFVASCLLAVVALGAGEGGARAAASVAMPVLVLGCVAAGTIALRRDRMAVAAMLFAPPILACLALLLIGRR